MLRTLILAFVAFVLATVFVSVEQVTNFVPDSLDPDQVILDYDETEQMISAVAFDGEHKYTLQINIPDEDDFANLMAYIDLVREISTTAPIATPPPPTEEPTRSYLSPYHLRLRVIDDALNVRKSPSVDSKKIAQLPVGSVFLTDPDSELESDGFIWHRHALGWSAIGSLEGTPHAEITDGLDLRSTPHYATVFTTSPVDLEEIAWLQYFGDTVFARAYGHLHNYDGYAEGLHGGLDFGIDSGETHIPRAVFAGTIGVIEARLQNAIWISHGDYVIKYQHLESIPNYQRGDLVMPDTFLGNISTNGNAPDNVHLHLEVVYDDRILVNPAQLMLTPIPWHLYNSTGYAPDAEFQNPNHQPVIELTQ